MTRSESRIKAIVLACVLATIACLMAALLCGCTGAGDKQQGGNDPQPRTFTDSAGRTVEIPDAIDRVAVTNAAAQEMLITLAPSQLVGLAEDITEQQATYLDPDLAKLPVLGLLVGDDNVFSKASLEKADPQVIIDVSPKYATTAESMDTLQKRTGLPCIHVDTDMRTLGEAYQALGGLLGKEKRAEELATYCNSAIAAAENALARAESGDKPRIAYLLGSKGTRAMPHENPQAAVVDKIATNIMRLDPTVLEDSGTPTSAEQVALWDPDIILFGSSTAYRELPSAKPWSEMTAITKGAYYVVPHQPYNWLSSPVGANQLLGLFWLTTVCYPSDAPIDLQKQATEHYKLLYGHMLTTDEYEELTEHALPKTKKDKE